jgi:nucleotide-binding universal stress UspA family protein
MYQRILVPVDGSSTAQRGLTEAIRLARLTGGQLRLLHQIDALSMTSAMGAYAPFSNDVFAQMRSDGEKLLEEARAQAIAEGVATDVVLDDGVHSRLAEWVTEQVQAWPADVVVLGTHGRRGVGRMLLGSDAEQVLRLCPVPVLLVRSPDTE